MAKLTDGKKTVDIFAESEQEEVVNKVAQYSVQSGNAISDHTQRESIEWTMTGLIQGKDHNEITVVTPLNLILTLIAFLKPPSS